MGKILFYFYHKTKRKEAEKTLKQRFLKEFKATGKMFGESPSRRNNKKRSEKSFGLVQTNVSDCVHLIKLLQAGRTIPNLTTLFLLVMNVAYVKNNPAPAPKKIKKKERKKTLIKSKGKAMVRHEIPSVNTSY